MDGHGWSKTGPLDLPLLPGSQHSSVFPLAVDHQGLAWSEFAAGLSKRFRSRLVALACLRDPFSGGYSMGEWERYHKIILKPLAQFLDGPYWVCPHMEIN